MKNIEAVRSELALVFAGLKDGTLDPKQAVEMNNCAGKVINSLKVELEYHALRKETPDIKFFKTEAKEAQEV